MRRERRFGRRLIGVAALMLLHAQSAHPAPKIVKTTLTTAREVHSLSPAAAERRRPVLIRGWVTYYDPYADTRQAFMFLHDLTGDIFVSLPKLPVLAVRQGTPVEISGVSDAGEFAPIVAHASARPLDGPIVSIDAQPVELPLLLLGGYDARFITVRGVVQSVFGSDRNMVLKLSTANGVVLATTLREPQVDYTRLVDAEVRIRANVAPGFNHRRQVTGAHLYFASMDDVSVVQNARLDPFASPPRPIDDLTKIATGLGVLHSIAIQGRVTLQWPGNLLCVEDASGGLCVESTQPDVVGVGELVDVVGFPRMGDTTAGLVEARFRRRGTSHPVTPVKTTPAEVLRGRYAGELVAVEGRLIGGDQDLERGEERTLTMEGNGTIFRVVLPDERHGVNWHAPVKGSVLRLTGVCLPEIDSHRREVNEGQSDYDSFRLLLRSPNDVAVVETPSWWSGPHVFAVILFSVIACTVVCGWVVVLRRQVALQTCVIRKSEERFRYQAEHDGLTGLANRHLLHERLEAALAKAKEERVPMAVLMLDLDRFKQVNDTFGHHIGDAMLCAAADRIRASVRVEDTVARTGGDEFVVLMPRLHHVGEADAAAERIVTAICFPLEVDGHPIPMAASVGVCTYPEGGEGADMLLRNCDKALYGAKTRGRNCWRSFHQLSYS